MIGLSPLDPAGRQPRADESGLERRAGVLWRISFDPLLLVDDERRYLRVNQPAANLLGAPADEILRSRIERFTPRELWPVLERLWASFTRRGWLEGPYEMLRGDGARVLIQFRASRDFHPGKHLIVAREVSPPRTESAPRRSAAGRGEVRLTQRELEILQLAADGLSTRKIAELLVVSPTTVKTHFDHLYAKFGVHDRAAAVAEGLRRGDID
jgi:DNA-binding CsgD family transcriptional regulator